MEILLGSTMSSMDRVFLGRRTPLRAGLLLAFLFLAASTVKAEPNVDLPSDVGAWQADGDAVLPGPLPGYIKEERDAVTWMYPEEGAGVARKLQQDFPGRWKRVCDELGAPTDGALVIRVVKNPEDMSALAPLGHPPPAYASGVAYPAFGVILLTLTAPKSWVRPNMEALLTHELSHVALGRAAGTTPVPRWFAEGVAIYQAEEFSTDRMRTLWGATLGGDLIPLSQLSRRFPARAHEVNLAYAESADVVRFLLRDRDNDRRFRVLLKRMREGKSFEEAMLSAYYVTPRGLEREWRADVNDRFQALPLLVGGGSLWALAGLLLVIVYVRRRAQNRKRLAEMAQEEAALDRLEKVIEEREEDDDEVARLVLYVSGDPPQGREPEVPTVNYEGNDHTLH